MKTKLKMSPHVRRSNRFTDLPLVCGRCGRECKSVIEFEPKSNPDIVAYACMNHNCINETAHAMESTYGIGKFTGTMLKHNPIRYKIGHIRYRVRQYMRNYMRHSVGDKFRKFFGIWRYLLVVEFYYNDGTEGGTHYDNDKRIPVFKMRTGDYLRIHIGHDQWRNVKITRRIFNVKTNTLNCSAYCDDFNPPIQPD